MNTAAIRSELIAIFSEASAYAEGLTRLRQRSEKLLGLLDKEATVSDKALALEKVKTESGLRLRKSINRKSAKKKY